MPWKSVKTKHHQFVLFRSIYITNSFRSNYPRCPLLYSPITISFVYRVTKIRVKKLGTGVRISNPCPLSFLTLPHTLWHQTHTQKEQ